VTRLRHTAVLVALPLAATLAISGCGSKKSNAAGPAAAAPHSSLAPAGGSTSPGPTASSSGASGAATRTCPGGDVRGTINGAIKCLAAGQQCSAKAVSQYPQYGFVCRPSTKGYLLSRA
jgi:hypothetical protein